jgi:YVTN family beta-propeller protein
VLEFWVLGPVRATDDGREIPLGGVKQRSLLALLLLHPGTVLSADRLIDELWGEAPPADATTALQAHVSRLRKALAPLEVIHTRAPGYVVQDAVVDADRFRALAAEGRHAEALALWSGRALDDVRYEPWAASHAEALDEERLAVLEARMEADLAAGRDVLAELQDLVREHPLREPTRGQLMLALYRAGRHAEALDAYTAYRKRLAAELGLEPGPELRRLQERILGHDPVLGGRRAPLARTRRRAPLALAAVAALAALGLGLALGGGDDRHATATGDGGALVELDARTGEPGDRFAVGTTPSAVALGEGAAWVVDADDQTVSRISDDVDTFAIGATPTGVAVGGGAVWVGAGAARPGGQVHGPVTTGLAQVDPGARTVRARVDLPAGRTDAHVSEQAVAVSSDAVWAIAPDGRLLRIAGEARTPVRGPRALAVAAAGEDIWVLGGGGEVGRVDESTRRIADPVKITASALGGLAAGEGSAWVAAPADGTLWRIDAGTPPSTRTIDVGVGATGVAVGAGAVWVTNPLEGTVVRVDPATNRVTQRVRLGGTPRGVAAAGDRVVVAVTGDAPAAASVAGGLPRGTCGPLLTAGDGEPERLIVSDLPLQGGLRLSTQQMVQAIELVLREHGFRAGRFRLGYQSCDDSIARTGLFDEAKCAANARLYARAEAVVGVVGQVNSPCTAAALPVANRAGLAMVSPLSSAVPLTRGSPAELGRLYPTGRRTFARVFGADDHQSQALAALAHDLGAERVATIDDGTAEYGSALARVFERSATARGLDVVATERWRPGARGYAGVAARVARRRPQAVMVSGLLDNGGPAVVKALRAALGPDVALLLVDGLTPTDLLVDEAGEAARGAYLSYNGLTPDQFGPAGRRFAAKLGATLPGAEIEPGALYAAAATEVLLDAIARSDGTRASVAGVLHETRLDTVVGRLSFTAAGDPVGSPVTIVRLRPGARDDAVFDRLVRP